MSQNKTDTSVPSGAGDNEARKSDSTGSAKAAARKKQQQQKNQKSNPPAKKKSPQQAVKSVFAGIASGVSPMKVIVVADGNVSKEAGGSGCGRYKAYWLDSAILDLITMEL
jgi:hypothetical protein